MIYPRSCFFNQRFGFFFLYKRFSFNSTGEATSSNHSVPNGPNLGKSEFEKTWDCMDISLLFRFSLHRRQKWRCGGAPCSATAMCMWWWLSSRTKEDTRHISRDIRGNFHVLCSGLGLGRMKAVTTKNLF